MPKSAISIKRHLTRTQKRLIADLDKIKSAAGLDYRHVLNDDFKYSQDRTVFLQVIIRETVRGKVVTQYTLIDEHLGSSVCSYLFDNKKFTRLWTTRKFERFNYFILEKMSLIEKLAFVKDIYSVPRAITANIENINALRNGLAHAFFPENLRAHRMKHGSASRKLVGPHYKGVDIFTFPGFSRFLDDSHGIVEFMTTTMRRKKGRRASPTSRSRQNPRNYEHD